MDRPAPPDLPDDPPNVVPVFVSRRKAEKLPSLRPDTGSRLPREVTSNGFDQGWCRRLARADWQAGFRWGVAATVGGLCLVGALAVSVLK